MCKNCEAEAALTGLDVEGREVKPGLVLMGTATKMQDGTWRCLANVGGALCLVEVSINFEDRHV